ncbi:septation protein IspZ, partial [Sphingomonas bacterium]|uniref:septation protein IspZ n=1 Tax=Sphingomonas bacterium TaxID=1895847 RepID=UPI001C2D71CA
GGCGDGDRRRRAGLCGAMSDDLASLANPGQRRRVEMSALVFAIRPLAIDLASTLCFYMLLAITGSLVVATVSGMVLGLAQLGWMRWRRQRIAAMQWAMLLLVGVVGGVTLALNDARPLFFQVSAAYLIIGLAMLQPGWIGRYVPPIAMARLPRRLVVASGFVWAGLILITGLLNLALILTVPVRTAAAVFGIWAASSKLVLFAGQYLFFRAIVRRRIAAALR